MSGQPTDEQVRAGAEALVRLHLTGSTTTRFADLPDEAQAGWMAEARAVLEAALAVTGGSTDQHVIEFRHTGWTIQHPLACRPNLFDCPVNRVAEAELGAVDGPPAPPGRYEVAVNDLGDRLLIGDRVDIPPDPDRP